MAPEAVSAVELANRRAKVWGAETLPPMGQGLRSAAASTVAGEEFQGRGDHRRLNPEQVLLGAVLVGLLRLRQARLELEGVELVASGLCFVQCILHKPLLYALNGVRAFSLAAKVYLGKRGAQPP